MKPKSSQIIEGMWLVADKLDSLDHPILVLKRGSLATDADPAVPMRSPPPTSLFGMEQCRMNHKLLKYWYHDMNIF